MDDIIETNVNINSYNHRNILQFECITVHVIIYRF